MRLQTAVSRQPFVGLDEIAANKISAKEMATKVREASDVLKAMAHASRLMILCILCEGERSVTELERMLALRQPTVSQQLARLRNDGMVAARRDGKTIYYSLAGEQVREMVEAVQGIFCRGHG